MKKADATNGVSYKQIPDSDRLNLLMKLTGQINSNLDLDSLLFDIIRAVQLVMESEASSLMLYDKEQDKLILSIPTGPVTEEISGKELPKDQGIGGWVFMNQKPLIVNNVNDDSRFGGDLEPSKFKTRNIICVPLFNQNEEKIGVIQALNKNNGREFLKDDIPIFQALANQAAIAIENARLHEEQKQKMLLEQKLNLARSIQSGFLPKENPTIPGYKVAGFTKPATWVGGDYYDYISPDNTNNHFFALADVTGKGIPAALLTASIRSVLRTQIENDHSLQKTIDLVNRSIYRDTPIDKFITLFCGELDPESHKFSYVNAGHTDSLLIDYETNEIKHLHEGGVMLGIMEAPGFDYGVVSIKAGQQIIIYSDGVTEPQNEEGDLYEEVRFEEWLLEHPDLSPSQTIEELIKDVKDFSASEQQSDDITIIVIKRE